MEDKTKQLIETAEIFLKDTIEARVKQAKQEVINKIMEWAKDYLKNNKLVYRDDGGQAFTFTAQDAMEFEMYKKLEDFIKTIGDGE